MKRFLAALLCALMAGTVLAFAACTDGSSEGGEGNGNGGTPQTPVNPDAELPSFFVAEREGFEPPDSCPSTVFKTAAFDRSAISPRLN